MRLLIAGAAGFIGSHLSERFLQQGDHVVGVDDFSSGQQRHFEYLRATYPKFMSINADISSDTWKSNYFIQPIDGILHFASPASPPDYLNRPEATIRANVDGTRNLLEIARAHKCPFLYASTSEIYGDPLISPQPESYWGNVNSIGPRAVYDESKRMGETLVSLYNRLYGLDTRIIRIFNTYGPRMRLNDGRVVTNFIYQCLNDLPLTIYGEGTQTRSLCYVDDLVEGVVRVFKDGDSNPYNLGNPYEITIMELANVIMDLTEGSHSRRLVSEALPQDDPKRRCPDITRAQTLSGWKPQVSLQDGLLKTINYFKEKIVS